MMLVCYKSSRLRWGRRTSMAQAIIN